MTRYPMGKVILLTIFVMAWGSQTLASEKIDGNSEISYDIFDWLTPPVDPENPEVPANPEGEIVTTKGLLRLDFIPQLSFGSQAISDQDQVYFADAQTIHKGAAKRPNYVQVTDNRGTLKGWNLSVRQEGQFKNDTTKNKELQGAVLSFDKQQLNSTFDPKYSPTIIKDAIAIEQMGVTYPVAIADEDHGMGTWTIQFGSRVANGQGDSTLISNKTKDGRFSENKNSAISLFVPGKTKKDPVQYTAVITWIISELT